MASINIPNKNYSKRQTSGAVELQVSSSFKTHFSQSLLSSQVCFLILKVPGEEFTPVRHTLSSFACTEAVEHLKLLQTSRGMSQPHSYLPGLCFALLLSVCSLNSAQVSHLCPSPAHSPTVHGLQFYSGPG